MRSKYAIVLVMVLGVFGIWPVEGQAQMSPTINLTVSDDQISSGDSVTFNVTYKNNDEKELIDGSVMLNLALQNGLTVKSSSPPIELNGSQPVWRLPSVVESGGEGVLSITLLVGSGYTASLISASGSIDGQVDNSMVSSYSNQVAVQVTAAEEEEEDKTDDTEDKKDEESADKDKNEDQESTKEEIKISDLQAGVVSQDDVARLVGVLDLPESNVNAWDSRYLIIGAAAFVMILSAAIIAFFLGRKSK